MDTKYRARASGSDYHLRIEVGPVKVEGEHSWQWEFGETAEVHRESRFDAGPNEGDEFTVSFAAIGSHDTEVAKRRLLSYQTAVHIADALTVLVQVRGLENLTNEAIAEMWDGFLIDTDKAIPLKEGRIR